MAKRRRYEDLNTPMRANNALTWSGAIVGLRLHRPGIVEVVGSLNNPILTISRSMRADGT